MLRTPIRRYLVSMHPPKLVMGFEAHMSIKSEY